MTATAELDRTGLALLEAVLDSPEDDLVRLAMADYWEERGGGERAGYIRFAVRNPGELNAACRDCHPPPFYWPTPIWVAGGGATHPIDPVGEPGRLLASLPRETAAATLSRGFISSLTLPLAAFLKHAGAVFANHPVTGVTLRDVDVTPSGGGHWVFVPPASWTLVHWNAIIRVLVTTYRSEEEAIAALSSACVSFGCEAAKPIRAARLAAIAG